MESSIRVGLSGSTFCLFLIGSSVFAADQLILLDGESVSATIAEIKEDGRIIGENIPKGLDIDGLRRIDRDVQSSSVSDSTPVVELVGGGRLHVRSVAIADEQCVVGWAFGDDLNLSIDAVRYVKFDPKQADNGFERAAEAPSAEFDRIFLEGGGKIQRLTGLIVELDSDQITFEWKGKEQAFPRKNLFGIVFAQLAVGTSRESKSVVHLRDGSLLPSDIASLSENVLKAKLSPTSSVALPWQSVSSIVVKSSRLAFMSDLEPVEQSQQSIVTLSKPWQRDRSIQGRPLTLRDPEQQSERVFTKGVGMHSLCRLGFDIGGRYDVFAATIGIDAETDSKGNCVYKVLGDGKELYSQQVKGIDAPRELRLNVSGVDRLTLLVEPGEDLDLADHADWCDARVIRNSKK